MYLLVYFPYYATFEHLYASASVGRQRKLDYESTGYLNKETRKLDYGAQKASENMPFFGLVCLQFSKQEFAYTRFHNFCVIVLFYIIIFFFSKPAISLPEPVEAVIF